MAFAFDRSYIEPFKVLVRSLLRYETLLDCPVAIYSDDRELFDDPLVRLVADKPRLIDGELLHSLQRAARETVRRPELLEWNKGTFLKWAVFEPQATEQLLFLDVDMICRGPLEELLGLHSESPFLCVPQFQKSLLKQKDVSRPAEAIKLDLQKLLDGHVWGAHARRVNSGVMLVRFPLLSESFRRELLDFAHSSEPQINEQSHVSAYFNQRDGMRQMVSARYNFQEQFLHFVGPMSQRELLDQVLLLHYSGPKKPWKLEQSPTRASQREWFGIRDTDYQLAQ